MLRMQQVSLSAHGNITEFFRMSRGQMFFFSSPQSEHFPRARSLRGIYISFPCLPRFAVDII
nr:MAG TPA: hypothetical protein [Caudoviricetes sp.]